MALDNKIRTIRYSNIDPRKKDLADPRDSGAIDWAVQVKFYGKGHKGKAFLGVSSDPLDTPKKDRYIHMASKGLVHMAPKGLAHEWHCLVWAMVQSFGGRPGFLAAIRSGDFDRESNHSGMKARSDLTIYHGGLVRSEAKKIQYYSCPYQDLIQIGYENLIRAIELFNPHKGYKFSTYASPLIHKGMLSASNQERAIKITEYGLRRMKKALGLCHNSRDEAQFRTACDSLGLTPELTEALARQLQPMQAFNE